MEKLSMKQIFNSLNSIFKVIIGGIYLSLTCVASESSATPAFPSGISQLYTDSWTEYTEQQTRSLHPFHTGKYISNVVKAHMACDKPMSNTALFGITIYRKDTPPQVIPYDCIISSGKLRSVSGISCLNAKELIGDIPENYLSFFNNIFSLNPFLRINHSQGDLISFLKPRIKTAPIEGLINDRTYGSEINSFLHCEQTFINNLLLDPKAPFIKKLQQTAIASENITHITFDIITYNDMCPKCFSTCLTSLEQLKMILYQALHITDLSIPFNIIVSSFRPYRIDDSLIKSLNERLYSRGINVQSMDDTFCTQYMRNRTIGKVQISDITISGTPIKQILNPFFIKEESLLTLEKKISAIATIKDSSKLQLSICEQHIRELSLLLQYFSENNVIIDTVILNKINDFLSLISPDIESIFGRIYLAKKSLQELPKK